MNKLKVTIAGLLIACFGIGVINAQDKTTTAQTPAKKSTKKAGATAATSTDKKATAAPAADKAAKPAGQHLKKDGTPDKRYKENKTTAPASTDKPATKKPAGKKAAPKKAASDNKTM
jgi:hypothetical protein